jgi:hypothetical protein
MRSSKWLLGLSVVTWFAAIAVALGGCGSSSSGSPSGVGGRGGNIGGGGSIGTGGTSGGAAGAGAGGADAGQACTPMDASAATIAAGPLWGCLQSACMAQLVACASECACNNAVLGALQCVATGGGQTTCFAPVATGGGTNGASVAICLYMSTSGCSPNLDAGSDGPEDSGATFAGS